MEQFEGSGQSMEDAIVIHVADASTGVEKEYEILGGMFGRLRSDWDLVSQALMGNGGHYYDQMVIRVADGSERTIYFDITGFFGRDADDVNEQE
jgi:hypothetical protein